MAFLRINSKKAYHQWCKKNHPDRNQDDPTATERFQIVSAAWAKQYPLKVMVDPELTEEEKIALYKQGRCGVPVKGVKWGCCRRLPAKGSKFCYYHQPGTAHAAFIDDSPSRMFGLFYGFQRERTDNMCTARLENGMFCTQFRFSDKSLYCWKCAESPRRRRYNSI